MSGGSSFMMEIDRLFMGVERLKIQSTIRKWVGALLLLLGLAWGRPGPAGELVLDRIVAVVEDEIVLLSDLNIATQLWLAQTGRKITTEDELKQVQHDLLERMIESKVLVVQARKDSVVVTRQQIDQVVNQEIKNQRQEFARQYGSDNALEEQLQRVGLTFKEWRKRLRKQKEEELLQQRLEFEKQAAVKVSGKEVELFYKTYRDSLPTQPTIVTLSHIMLTVRPDSAAAELALQKIRQIQQEVKNGGDFGALAQQYSEDPGSAPNGGDIGFIAREDGLVPEFMEAAFQLNPGEVSEPVLTPFGYHLIKVDERKGERIRVRHILVRVGSSTRERLAQIRQEILAGKLSFAEAAQKYSDDAQSRDKGGSLGRYPLTAMLPDFQQAIQPLRVGAISEPVLVNNNYHIFKLDGREEARALSLQDNWDQIAQLAKQFKWSKERKRWIGNLKRNMFIDVRLEQ